MRVLSFDPDKSERDIAIIDSERESARKDELRLDGESLAAEGRDLFTWLDGVEKYEKNEALQAVCEFMGRFERWARRYGAESMTVSALRYPQKIIALEHLQKAMQAGASGDVLSEIVSAIKAIEK